MLLRKGAHLSNRPNLIVLEVEINGRIGALGVGSHNVGSDNNSLGFAVNCFLEPLGTVADRAELVAVRVDIHLGIVGIPCLFGSNRKYKRCRVCDG